jgi:hypothetical protein
MADNRLFTFGPGTAYATISVYTDGTTPAVLAPRRVDVLQSFDLDISFTTKKLMGQLLYPVAIGIGDAKVTGKIKTGRFNSGLLSDVAFGNNPATYQASGQTLVADQEAQTVQAAKVPGAVTGAVTAGATALTLSAGITGLAPGMLIGIATAGVTAGILYATLVSGATTSWVISTPALSTSTIGAITCFPSITVTNSATYVNDQGISLGGSGAYYSAIAPAVPTVGSTYVSALGVYSFATADAATKLLVSYTYTATAGQNITIPNLVQGSVGIYSLIYQGQYAGRKITVQLLNCVSNKFNFPTKQADFVIGEIDFECFANASNQVAVLGLAE